MNQTLKLTFNLSTIKSKTHFLCKMREFFEFPAYFGNNFDALDECMKDLSWFCQDDIVIEFYHLGRIGNHQLRYFIKECLVDYKEYWENNQDKNIMILILS